MIIKVLIVDDMRLFREGIKYLIEHDTEIEVIASASNGKEALELCSEHKPDVVLMDLIMPVMDGIDGTRQIKEIFNKIKVIMLTTSDDDEHIMSALASGADGYVLKEATPRELLLAIKSVVSGLNIIDQNVYKKIIDSIKTISRNGEISEAINELNLSEKEITVLRLLANGNSNKEIAENLFIAEGRVKNIITGLLNRLNLKDRTHLAIFAVKNNII